MLPLKGRQGDVSSREQRPSRRSLPVVAALAALGGLVIGMSLLTGCGGGDRVPSASPSAEVAATVNGRAVHRSRVEAVMAEARLSGQVIGEKKAVAAAIDEELVRQEAERLGIAATERSVDARVSDLEGRVGGAAALDQALQDAALTRRQLRERLAVVVLGERVAAAKFPDISVSRERSRAYYRRNPALFTSPAEVKLGDINCRTQRLAEAAIEKIEQGQSFYATARQFSTDPELERVGGQLGWVPERSLPGAIARAVATMKLGDVSASPLAFNGFHVLKLYARRAERTMPFAEVDGQIRSQLVEQEREAGLRRWLVEARASAEIELT